MEVVETVSAFTLVPYKRKSPRSVHTVFIQFGYGCVICLENMKKKEENVLFNDALITFCSRYIVSDI